MTDPKGAWKATRATLLMQLCYDNAMEAFSEIGDNCARRVPAGKKLRLNRREGVGEIGAVLVEFGGIGIWWYLRADPNPKWWNVCHPRGGASVPAAHGPRCCGVAAARQCGMAGRAPTGVAGGERGCCPRSGMLAGTWEPCRSRAADPCARPQARQHSVGARSRGGSAGSRGFFCSLPGPVRAAQGLQGGSTPTVQTAAGLFILKIQGTVPLVYDQPHTSCCCEPNNFFTIPQCLFLHKT